MENTSAGRRTLEKSIENLIETVDPERRERAFRLAANLIDDLLNLMAMSGPDASDSGSSSGSSTSSGSTLAGVTVTCPNPSCGRKITITLS